jgi:hypothetical protein
MLKFLVLLSIVAIIFAMPRGFDISDEGVYVLLADPNQENIGGIFNYDLFFKVIYKFTGLEFGIIGLRIIRLISYFIGAYGLALFWKNLFESQRLSSSIFLLALAGLFAGYGFLPPTLSYNSISVVAVCIWLAIISKKELNFWNLLFLGFIFSVLFYAKITVCFLLVPFTVVYLLVKKTFRIGTFILISLPFLLCEGLFYFLFQESGLTRLTGELGFLNQRQDYSILLLIKYTATGGFWVFLVGIFFISSATAKKYGFKIYLLILILGIVTIGIVFYTTLIYSDWSHSFLLITFAGICWQLGTLNFNEFNKDEWLFILILIFLPFLLHFGSNVYWMRLGIHYWVFWLLTLAILIRKKSLKSHFKFHFVASFCSFILIIFGIWITPYEGVYLWKSDNIWEYQPGKEILLSTQKVMFLEELRSEVNASDSKRIVSLFRNPGILYLLGKTSPYSPNYWKPSQARLFFQDGNELDMILFNELEPLPFDLSEWPNQKELIEPKGGNLLILWKN